MSRRPAISAAEQTDARLAAQAVAVDIADALDHAAQSIRRSIDPRRAFTPDTAAAVAQALRVADSVASDQRADIVSHLADVLPFETIAKITGTSVSTVARIIRARRAK